MEYYKDKAIQLIEYIYSDVNVLNNVLQSMRSFLVGRSNKSEDAIIAAWIYATSDITYNRFREQPLDDRTAIQLIAANILTDPSRKNKCQLFDAEYLCTDNTLTEVKEPAKKDGIFIFKRKFKKH